MFENPLKYLQSTYYVHSTELGAWKRTEHTFKVLVVSQG
jgi:hypothetical protein